MPVDKMTMEKIRRAAQEAEAEGKLGPPPEAEDEAQEEPRMGQRQVRPPQSALDLRGQVAQLVGLLIGLQQAATRLYGSAGEEHGPFLISISREAMRAETYASAMLANHSYNDHMAVAGHEETNRPQSPVEAGEEEER